MNYIKRIDKKIIVDGSTINTTFYKYLKHLSIANFKSIDALRISCKHNCNVKSEMPLYISKDILLVYSGSLISKDAFVINYLNVVDVVTSDSNTIIIFKDKTQLDLSISSFRTKTMLEKGKIVLKYITKNNI